ncbi:AAA family ATPase [Natronolimnobius sp. AArcel1]|uniref:ATP-binding protein n=1 Tax=Natronolimnobius sp. AArcel1 TaxID=1679093 RepID=UPI0013EB5E69|nr:AAA family ATPase [Natronolimnobius sp. AArcel1]NGM68024.1 AAA family ATPase [Natronolimnobius sp. AArcel1]
MYEHFSEHLQAEFDRLQWVLEYVQENPSLIAPPLDGGGSQLSTAGVHIRALSAGIDTNEHPASLETVREELTTRTETIDERVDEALEADVDLRLETIHREFHLTRADLETLLIVLAPAFDRSLLTIYGSLTGLDTPTFPTVQLAETLLALTAPESDRTESPLAPTAPLFEYDLLERVSENSASPETYDVLTVDDRIVRYLKGDDSLEPALAEYASLESHDRTLEELVFPDETAAALEGIATRSREAEWPTIYYASGEDGTGKDRLPGALTDPETPILRADAADILDDDAVFTRFIREATLQETAIHLEGLEAITEQNDGPTLDDDESGLSITDGDDTPTVDAIVERLDDAPGDVFLSHANPWTPNVDLEHHRLETCDCPFPDYETRLTIWEEYAAEFADDVLCSTLATNFRLPQRDIRHAVRTARYLCRTDANPDDLEAGAPADAVDESDESTTSDPFAPVDGELTREHCYDACKRYSASTLEALAEPLEPGYGWGDIALNDKAQTHLEELAGHLQYRGPVTSEWGFGEPGSRGDGVVALFYGQPGTGKTMAAEIIANETGLDLYRVDLSQVINKYVGETETRLAALLDEAERSNAILLFDEADAIFGKRAEVKDATDRYANTEINFLLQRLESFDGIVLLTTNKEAGIDPAFKRRIDHAIKFRKPQELIRRELWQTVFPDEAVVATDTFDYEFLGRLSTTPAVIRKVAKYAAYIAATESHDGRPLATATTDLEAVTITFDHIILALQYAKEAGGGGFEIDFREYEDKRRTYESATVERDWQEELRRTYGTAPDEANVDADTDAEGDTTAEQGDASKSTRHSSH